MSTPFSYSTTYILDKSHFSETFDESNALDNSKKAYLKGILLAILGLAILIFSEIHPYIAWFIIALGGLEVRSFTVESEISWANVSKIEQTSQGWLLYHAGGKSYLSNRCLSESAKVFIETQALVKPQ